MCYKYTQLIFFNLSNVWNISNSANASIDAVGSSKTKILDSFMKALATAIFCH